MPLCLSAALWAAFCGGGSLLAADAWQRAWRPPLRLAFEAIVAHDRSDGRGRSAADVAAAEDPDASAWLTGVLREDASPRAERRLAAAWTSAASDTPHFPAASMSTAEC